MIRTTSPLTALTLTLAASAAPLPEADWPLVAAWPAGKPLPTADELETRALESEWRLAERMDRMRGEGAGCGLIWTDFQRSEDIVILSSSSDYQVTRIYYIDATAPLGGDGTSWDTAFQSLQDAITSADYEAQIVEFRIAGGLYRADRINGVNTSDPEQTIELPGLVINPIAEDDVAGVKHIKGGYAGRGAKNPDERDIELYQTVFTGDLLGDDDATAFLNYEDNTRVLFLPNQTELNGITIEHARIAAHELRWMTDCTVRYCYASGDDLPIERDFRAPVFAREARLVGSTFHNNRGEAYGGAIGFDGRTVVANSRFLQNSAPAGGAIAAPFDASFPDLIVQNCYFAANAADGALGGVGGAVFVDGLDASFAHCTFVGNLAVDGGASGAIYSIVPSIWNCIFDQNHAFNGTGLDSEVSLGPTFSLPATIEANVFRAFNDNSEFFPPPTLIRLNTGADPEFADLLGPDGVLGTVDDDPSLATNSPAIGSSVAPPDGPSVRYALQDLADLDGDCDVFESLPIDLLGNPRAIESAPGVGVDGYAADAGCIEYVPGNEPTTGQPWSFVDPLITDFSTEPIRLHVRSGAPSGGDGLTWETAFAELCTPLDVAAGRVGPVEIWVSAGVYRADCERSNLRAFRVQENVSLLGGFAGDETSADQRDWEANLTTLTGDLLGNDDPNDTTTLEDNAPHVVLSAGPRGGGLVDGFVLEDGLPQGYIFGPGLYWVRESGLGGKYTAGLVFHASGDLTIQNCVFGRMPSPNASTVALAGQRANLTIRDSRVKLVDSPVQPVRFLTNDRVLRAFPSMEGLGRVILDGCEVVLRPSRFIWDWSAGEIRINRSRIVRLESPGVTPSIFTLRSDGYQPVSIRNSVFIGHSVIQAQDVSIENSTFQDGRTGVSLLDVGFGFTRAASITNSVFAANFGRSGSGDWQISSSVFRDSTDPGDYLPFGEHNTTFDFESDGADFFVDPLGPDGEPYTGDEDLRLAPGSPAINTGLNAFVESEFDLDGNERIIGTVVDRGAYEFTGTCTGDVNGDGVIDLGDLNKVLSNFGQDVPFGDADASGSVDMTDLSIVLAAFGSACGG